MAFTPANFITDSQANTNAPRIHRYRESATLASIKAANYFNGAVNGTSGGGYGLRNGDVILVDASNGISMLHIAVDASNNATVAAANDFT
jgi:hypothetical protein